MATPSAPIKRPQHASYIRTRASSARSLAAARPPSPRTTRAPRARHHMHPRRTPTVTSEAPSTAAAPQPSPETRAVRRARGHASSTHTRANIRLCDVRVRAHLARRRHAPSTCRRRISPALGFLSRLPPGVPLLPQRMAASEPRTAVRLQRHHFCVYRSTVLRRRVRHLRQMRGRRRRQNSRDPTVQRLRRPCSMNPAWTKIRPALPLR